MNRGKLLLRIVTKESMPGQCVDFLQQNPLRNDFLAGNLEVVVGLQHFS